MLSVRLKPELADRLDKLVHDTHRSKSYYVERALEEFLTDQEDYLFAEAAYQEYLTSGKKSIALQELEKKLKLHD